MTRVKRIGDATRHACRANEVAMTDRTAAAALNVHRSTADTLKPYWQAMVGHMDRLCRSWPSGRSPSAAIRRKCIDCCGGSVSEVRQCEAIDCPLWLYRLGTPRHLKEVA